MSESTTPPLERLREMLNTDNTEGQFDCRVSAGVRNLFYQRRGNSLTWLLQWTANGKLQTMGLGPPRPTGARRWAGWSPGTRRSSRPVATRDWCAMRN